MAVRLSYRLALFTVTLVCAATTTQGAEITHVSTIREGLTAPTSLCISEDRLAVLEPYTKQLMVYTADGIVRQRVNIDGSAIGLGALSASRYIYGDRSRRRVVGIDVITGDQFDFVTRPDVVKDPTDLLVENSSVFVLDAGLKAIVKLTGSGVHQGRLPLQDSSGHVMEYPSSFAYEQTDDQFLVLDQISSKMWVFSASGEFRYSFGTFGSSATDLSRGGELACDNRGMVYVVDRYQGRVLIYRTDGTYADQISLFSEVGSGAAVPIGIAVDDQGLVYVASTEAARIDIFQVTASGATIEEMLVATPVTPLSDDTVDFRSATLTAQLTLPAGLSIPGQFDFQLFLGSDTMNAVALGFAIAPRESVSEDSKNMVATWRPMELFLPDTLYRWRVRARADGHVGPWSRMISFATTGLPASYALYQNYPNPFNPATHILFTTPRNGHVSITIYNVLGQRVTTLVDEQLPAGEHEVTWAGVNHNGVPVASGIYFYRLVAETYVSTKTMVVVK
ncbi:MAG TPA: T9SS type A sorting domain-containing protein [Candidatus Deferrimicrobium sp.]|nr:T9SS type A sorting domain-containing protein [Candidatus Deferrimicrobium sp.]